MRYLITGRNGQLARAYIRKFQERSWDFSAPDESKLDITNLDVVLEAVSAYKPDVIINCAAYNLVDRGELEHDKIMAVNAEGPRNLALAAARQKAIIVHFSSDYVFDGAKESGLYTEGDPLHPLNEYGKSKQAGENLVSESTEMHLVFRLSWVFGAGQQNFIYKLSEWAKNSEYLKIACDEFSVPTYTETVVDVSLEALEQGLTGLYHLTNSGFCSRYEWANCILHHLGINKFIRPVSMDTFNLPAQRPKFSAMSSKALMDVLGRTIPTWEEAVKVFLQDEAHRRGQ